MKNTQLFIDFSDTPTRITLLIAFVCIAILVILFIYGKKEPKEEIITLEDSTNRKSETMDNSLKESISNAENPAIVLNSSEILSEDFYLAMKEKIKSTGKVRLIAFLVDHFPNELSIPMKVANYIKENNLIYSKSAKGYVFNEDNLQENPK